jgi:hypothetical protein
MKENMKDINKSINSSINSLKLGSNTNTLFIFITSTAILFSLLIYLKPEWFVFLFGDILGQVVLVLAIGGLVYIKEYKLAIGLGCIFVLLYQSFLIASSSKKVEGFTDGVVAWPHSWPQELVDRFLKFENTFYPTLDINLNMLMSQASVEEVEYLLREHKWPWSVELKLEYVKAMSRNKIVKSYPIGQNLEDAQKVYNENAMRQQLFWNTKEGAFVLDGVSIGGETVIRCAKNESTGDDALEKIQFDGYDPINFNVLTKNSFIDTGDIEREVPGFKFMEGSGQCNPCSNLSSAGSCRFSVSQVSEAPGTFS